MTNKLLIWKKKSKRIPGRKNPFGDEEQYLFLEMTKLC